MDQAGKRLASRRLPEGLTGIRQLHELIAEHAEEPDQVVIGIETDRGLWAGALAAAGYQVFAVNPLAVARYRDRHHHHARLCCPMLERWRSGSCARSDWFTSTATCPAICRAR
jgi:hypothetical protein